MRPLITLLATLLLTAPLHAQFDAKLAVKTFKADAKLLTKQQKSTQKAEWASLKGRLKAASAPFTQGTGDQDDVTAIFDEIVEFQNNLFIDVANAGLYGKLGFTLLAEDFADDPDTPEFYLPGMTSGDGGLLDDFLAASQKRLEQQNKKLQKQVSALSKLIEKKSGLLVSARLRPVYGPIEAAANLGATFAGDVPTHIDTIVAVSNPDSGSVNRIYVSGTTSPDPGGMLISLEGADSLSQVVTIDVTTSRFAAMFSAAPPGLPRGNYTVRAQRGDDDSSDIAAIGLR